MCTVVKMPASPLVAILMSSELMAHAEELTTISRSLVVKNLPEICRLGDLRLLVALHTKFVFKHVELCESFTALLEAPACVRAWLKRDVGVDVQAVASWLNRINKATCKNIDSVFESCRMQLTPLSTSSTMLLIKLVVMSGIKYHLWQTILRLSSLHEPLFFLEAMNMINEYVTHVCTAAHRRPPAYTAVCSPAAPWLDPVRTN